jgi:hypothetical protein
MGLRLAAEIPVAFLLRPLSRLPEPAVLPKMKDNTDFYVYDMIDQKPIWKKKERMSTKKSSKYAMADKVV